MNGSLCIKGHPLLNPAGFGQVLDQPHPLILLLLSPRGDAEDFCFSFSPITILASAAVRGLSAFRSVPSPSSSFWPRRRLKVSDPAWTLRLLQTSYKRGMYRKTLLGNKHCYVLPNTLFSDINKTVVPYHFCALLQLCTSIL